MVVNTILFFALGACLASEFAVFFLVPSLLLAAAAVVWCGISLGHLHAMTIALHLAALLIAVQGGYFLGALVLSRRKSSPSALAMRRGAAR